MLLGSAALLQQSFPCFRATTSDAPEGAATRALATRKSLTASMPPPRRMPRTPPRASPDPVATEPPGAIRTAPCLFPRSRPIQLFLREAYSAKAPTAPHPNRPSWMNCLGINPRRENVRRRAKPGLPHLTLAGAAQRSRRGQPAEIQEGRGKLPLWHARRTVRQGFRSSELRDVPCEYK